MTRSQIKSGAVLSYVALILGSVVGFTYIPFMLRKLGQAEYGLFSLVNTTIAYLTILDFGFGNALVRYSVKFRAESDKVREESLYGMFLLLYIGIGLIAFLFAIVLILNIEQIFSATLTVAELKTARGLMWLAAVNVALSFPFSVFTSIITSHERFIFAKVVNLFRLIINPLLMVLVLTLGYKSIGMLAMTTGLNLFINSVNMYYCISRLNVVMRFKRFDIPLLKEISVYSFYIFLNIVVDRLYWSTGQLLLGILVGTVSVAIYAISLQFITMLYMPVSSATAGLFLPRVTQISIRETANQELSDLFIRVGRIQFIMLALVLTGFILFGQQFVSLWAGPDYSVSYLVILVIMVPLTVPLIQNMGISILQANNLHAFRSVVFLAVASINVVISIPLIKMWGVIGTAVSMSFSIAIQIIIMNIYYQKHLHLEIGRFWREIVKLVPSVLLPSVFWFFSLQWFPALQFSAFAVNVLLFTVAYCLSMFFLGMNQYEKQLVLYPLKYFTNIFKVL